MHLSRYLSRAGPIIVPGELMLPGMGYVKGSSKFENPVAKIGSIEGGFSENQR
jgi:hypothetical protein